MSNDANSSDRKHTILCVAGARPNFMKIAPVLRAISGSQRLRGRLVHTGQHYDANMSRVFFEELGLPQPDFHLEVGSGPHGRQTGKIMCAFEPVLEQDRPDLVLVVGDVNSTVACALVAAKLHIPVAHVEAGLRSRDRSMPEELNRVLTDQLSDLLFTTEAAARENLLAEGIDESRIHFVGNTMIDSLVHALPAIEGSAVLEQLAVKPSEYCVLTFHRPSNVDVREQLERLVGHIEWLGRRLRIVFPIHPRTRAKLDESGMLARLEAIPQLTLTEPLRYTDFLALVRSSRFVLTDSGGIQEETTWLGVPCLTQRTSTERPVTIELGTNRLLGEDFARTEAAVEELLASPPRRGERPPLWDGKCGERIGGVLESFLRARSLP